MGGFLKTKMKKKRKANACHVIEEHVPSFSSPQSRRVVRVWMRKSKVQNQTDYRSCPKRHGLIHHNPFSFLLKVEIYRASSLRVCGICLASKRLLVAGDTNPLWGCMRKGIRCETLPKSSMRELPAVAIPRDKGAAESSFQNRICVRRYC